MCLLLYYLGGRTFVSHSKPSPNVVPQARQGMFQDSFVIFFFTNNGVNSMKFTVNTPYVAKSGSNF